MTAETVRGARCVVTGGAGMIGSNLVKRLVSLGAHVSVVDNLWRGRLEHLLDERGEPAIDLESDFHEIDLSVPGAIDDILDGGQLVFHLADVVAGIGYVFDNQGSIFRQNVLINSNVFHAVRSRGAAGLIYVGTACSFPAHLQTGPDALPLREQDLYPASPESAYGWSKLMGHYEADLLAEEVGVPVATLVLHNVYGTPTDYSARTGQVIPSLVRKAIRYPQEPFVVWGSGAQGRAFVHVNDVVDALVGAATEGLGRGVIQIGPDVCTTIRELAETIVTISGKDIEIQFDRTAPEGDGGRSADFSKASEILAWEPRVTLWEGISELHSWMSVQLGEHVRPEGSIVSSSEP